ncbi:unnamed protein product [Phaedon cochleariae]|uniref:MD-2-related lipid-recognition domain-containing protein n=1 Tax=Phaedon cochleariae TaxID=80249 RepID=A0A9N9SJU4_PHACE|nr:unnamed protein product [Phaedon cochleariae]
MEETDENYVPEDIVTEAEEVAKRRRFCHKSPKDAYDKEFKMFQSWMNSRKIKGFDGNRHGRWKSSTVAEGYLEESVHNKIQIAERIQGSNMSASSNNTISSCTDMGASGSNEPTNFTITSNSKEPLAFAFNLYINVNLACSTRYLENIRPKVLARAAIIELDYSAGLHQDNACDGLKNTVCPLVENEKIQYGLSLKLETWFPKVSQL